MEFLDEGWKIIFNGGCYIEVSKEVHNFKVNRILHEIY